MKKIQWAQIKRDQFTHIHGLQHSPINKCFHIAKTEPVTQTLAWTGYFVWSTRIKGDGQ